MIYVIVVCALVFFGLVVFRGAPYVPTHAKAVELALDMLNLKPGDTLLDLGSGDGVVLARAAKRGIHAVGYEINPLLVAVSWLRCWRFHNIVKVKVRDLWVSRWPAETSAVFVFLARPYMAKFKKRLDQEMSHRSEPLLVISYGFKIPGLELKRSDSGVNVYKILPS